MIKKSSLGWTNEEKTNKRNISSKESGINLFKKMKPVKLPEKFFFAA